MALRRITDGMTGLQAANAIYDNDNDLQNGIAEVHQVLEEELQELRDSIPDVTALTATVTALSTTVVNNKNAAEQEMQSIRNSIPDVAPLTAGLQDVSQRLTTLSTTVTNNKNAAEQEMQTIRNSIPDVAPINVAINNLSSRITDLSDDVAADKAALTIELQAIRDSIVSLSTINAMIADVYRVMHEGENGLQQSINNTRALIPTGNNLEYTQNAKDRGAILYGDSVFSGDYQFMAQHLQDKLGCTVLTLGISGQNAEQLASEASLAPMLDEAGNAIIMLLGSEDIGAPSTVGTFSAGMNPLELEPVMYPSDVNQPYSGLCYIQAVDYIVRRILKARYTDGIRLLVCDGLPQQRNNAGDDYSRIENNMRKALAVREVCARNNVPCVHTFDKYGVYMPAEPFWQAPTDPQTNHGVYTMDGLHPNDVGANVLTTIIADAMRAVVFPLEPAPDPEIGVNTLTQNHTFNQYEQSVNLLGVLNNYAGKQKKYAFTVSDLSGSTENFFGGSSLRYAYSQDVNGNRITATSTEPTIYWTAGSTGRYVIVVGGDFAHFPIDAIWCITRLPLFRCGDTAGNANTMLVQADRAIGLTVIPDRAFFGCTSLETITISGVTEIGQEAFSGCTSIFAASLPDSLTRIGDAAFEGCTAMISATIPPAVGVIGYNAFKGCTSLMVLSDDIRASYIGSSAFEGCTSLTTANLLHCTITTLPTAVFRGCIALDVPTLPPTLTGIGEEAFNGCSGLTELTIPASVITIGAAALNQCITLYRINCKAFTPPTLTGTQVFAGVRADALHVPVGRKAAYDAVAQWTDFEPIVADL